MSLHHNNHILKKRVGIPLIQPTWYFSLYKIKRPPKNYFSDFDSDFALYTGKIWLWPYHISYSLDSEYLIAKFQLILIQKSSNSNLRNDKVTERYNILFPYRIIWKFQLRSHRIEREMIEIRHNKGASGDLFEPGGECVHNNPDTVPASQHRQSFRQSVWSLYLPLGSIGTLFLIMHQNSSGGRGLLSSLGIKESKAPGLWSLLQHQSLKSVLPAFCSWHRKLYGIQVIYGSSVFYLR